MGAAAYISILLNGVLTGGVYGLVSSAFTFQSGALRFANFAYGASIMLSMYITYFGIREWNLPIPVAILLVLLMNLVLGIVLRKTVLRTNNYATQILCTMGIQLVIINMVTFVFTSYPRDMGIFETRIYITPDISIGSIQLICFVLAAVILIGFQLFLSKTWTGRAIRAVVQNRDAADLMGIKSKRILDLAFSLSYMLIGVSGIMLMTMFQVEPNFGNYMQTIAFVVCVSAGLGNLGGAFFSGIIVGVLSAAITTFLGAAFHDVVLFSLFIVILLVRPFGIFGNRARVARDI